MRFSITFVIGWVRSTLRVSSRTLRQRDPPRVVAASKTRVVLQDV
jgi:hypothetical protein